MFATIVKESNITNFKLIVVREKIFEFLFFNQKVILSIKINNFQVLRSLSLSLSIHIYILNHNFY